MLCIDAKHPLFVIRAYKPVLSTQGVRSIIHPLCGCATNVIQKKSPSRYNVVVEATLKRKEGDFYGE